MNLGDILERVEDELQYQPDLLEHRRDFRRVINEVYQALGRERLWPWLWRSEPMWVLPDITLVNEDVTAEPGLSLVSGQFRRFQIDKQELVALLGLGNGELTIYLQRLLLNAELDLADPTGRGGINANFELAPFVIEDVDAVLPDDASDPTITVDPRCRVTGLGVYGSFVIRPRRVRLPLALDSLDAILDDQGLPLPALSPRVARNHLDVPYPEGNTGAASYVLEDGGFASNQGLGNPFERQLENQPFRDTFSVVAVAGTIPSGTIVRVILSWSYAGRYGPPSRPVEFTVTDLGGVRVDSIPLLPETSGENEYGRSVAVFMAEGEGAFFLRGLHNDEAVDSFDITTPNSDLSTVTNTLRFDRWDEVYPGTYKYVRFEPHPDEVKRFTCHYWARPRKLIEDTDEPEFEEAYHDLIVWLVCETLNMGRFGDKNALQRFTVLAARRRAALDSRYFPQQKHAGTVRGMIGTPRRTRAPFPPVDWNGDS